jgi:hypothetical protein
MPLDHFAVMPALYDFSSFDEYGLGSYAFHGEAARGRWQVYAVASNPLLDEATWGRAAACRAAPADGIHPPADAWLWVEARIIAQ